jgi:endonuclease YncB( thermonuclease family)
MLRAVRRVQLAVVCSLLGLLSLPVAHAAGAAASLVDVIDAATLDVQLDSGSATRIHLVGIDPTDGQALGCASPDVGQRIRDLTSAGFSVDLRSPAQATTVFDGQPADVWLADGRNLADVLLREGDAFSSGVGVGVGVGVGENDQDQALSQAQAAAVANGLGIWAPGVCVSHAATALPADVAADRAALVGYLTHAADTLQQAKLGVNVLGEQARSAPLLIASPGWQHTTSTAVGWLDVAAKGLQAQVGNAHVQHPVPVQLAQLGADLQARTDAYAQAVASGDAGQVQAAAETLAEAGAALPGASAEVLALQAAYGAGD